MKWGDILCQLKIGTPILKFSYTPSPIPLTYVNYVVPQHVSPFEDSSVMASVKSLIHYLIVMVGSTVNYFGGNQLAVGYTSVTIALVMFIGILDVFQLADVTGITQCLRKKYNNMRDT